MYKMYSAWRNAAHLKHFRHYSQSCNWKLQITIPSKDGWTNRPRTHLWPNFSLILLCSECAVPQIRQKERKTHVENCEVVLGGLNHSHPTATLQLADVCEKLSRTSWPKERTIASESEEEKTTYRLSGKNWEKPRTVSGPHWPPQTHK